MKEKAENLQTNSVAIQNTKTCSDWLLAVFNGFSVEDFFYEEYGVDYFETNFDIFCEWEESFHRYLDEHLTDVNRDICKALYYNLAGNNQDELFGQGTSLAQDWQDYMARHEGEKFSPIFMSYIDTSKVGLEEVKTATELFDTVIAEGITVANEAANEMADSMTQEMMDDAQQEMDSYNQKIEELQNEEIAGESYPVAVSLIIDGTGNNVQFEALVMLGEDEIEYAIGHRGVVYSGESRKAIYESQYAVYGATTDGLNVAGFMLVRDDSKNGAKFGIDTLETESVYIDAEEYSDFTE